MAEIMRRRGVVPDGSRLRADREKRGLTQVQVAKKVGLSETCVLRVESGARVDRKTLKKLADFYHEAFDDLLIPDIADERDARDWLARAKEYDSRMNYGRAIEIARIIIDALDEMSEVRAQAVVALAAYLDHVNCWREGISLLEKHFFSRKEGTAPAGIQRQWRWALYARGLLRRRYAEAMLTRTMWSPLESVKQLLAAARRDFESCRKRCRSQEDAGIDHHLGVLDLLEGDYHSALKRFRRAQVTREERHEQRLRRTKRNAPGPPPSIRLAYSYRRLATCHMLLDNANEAKLSFEQAREIAVAHQHARLLAEVEADMDAWGIDVISNT